MSMRWTPAQQAVIDSRGGSLLVSAAAGSGKTAVMVERVLDLVVNDGVPLERMLIVTFTRAAASEMKARIGAALEAQLAAAQGEEGAVLRAQLDGLEDAPISTLHAYCATVLRQYGHVIGMDPSFRLAGDDERALLWEEAVDAAIERCLDDPTPGMQLLADAWGGRDGAGLAGLAEQVYAFACANPGKLDWLDEAVAAYAQGSRDAAGSPWMQAQRTWATETLQAAQALLLRAMENVRQPGGPTAYGPALEQDLRQLQQVEQALRCGEPLPSLVFAKLGRRKKDEQVALAEQAKALREEAKAQVGQVVDSILAQPVEALQADLARMVPVMEAMDALLHAVEEAYTASKARSAAVDFNDLEHGVLAILRDEQARRELQEGFDYVFVDEYQDINPVQEAILTAIARADNLFCVGDVKQSIYRFRQADPTLFLARYAQSRPEEGAGQRRIDLNQNFRSAPQVLSIVNHIFSCIMRPALGDVVYDEAAALHPGAIRPEQGDRDTACELMVLDRVTEGEDALADWSALEKEAQAAAGRIQALMERPLWDGKAGEYRPARYRDFVILLRAVSGKADQVAAVLQRAGIPTYADVDGGYLDEVEVAQVLDVLRLVDNRQRDLPWMTALHSAMGGLTLSELMAIRQRGGKDVSYAQAVLQAAQGEDGLSRKVARFVAQVDAWRAQAQRLDVDELIWRILDDTGFYDIVGALPAGDVRQANLRLLADRARALQQTPNRGLYAFLQHVHKLRRGGRDLSEGRTVSEGDDLVRIMSIHKSKGLEFPVVLVLGLGSPFNRMDEREALQLHRRLGLGPMAFDAGKRLRRTTLARETLLRQQQREAMSEQVRLLYVALTRARERLVLIGSTGRSQGVKLLGKWSRPLETALLADAGSFLDWVGAAALRHPDAAAWREQAAAAVEVLPCDAPLSVQLVDSACLPAPAAPAPAVVLPPAASGETAEAYLADFAWRYPHAAATRLPVKTSATALLEQADEQLWETEEEAQPAGGAVQLTLFGEEQPLPTPRSARATPEEAALRGTLTHKALQLLPLDLPPAQTAAYIQSLEQRGILSSGQGRLVDARAVAAFLRSDLAQAARQSRQVLREQPFVVALPAEQLDEAAYAGLEEPILVQGVLDLCFWQEGGWVLVDFKTNAVNAVQTPEALLAHYRKQLWVYAEALQRITGRPVLRRGLYLTRLGRTVWEAAREDS